ncbi:MAG: PKD domain-containing protein, partial [Candidatus Syntrophoarchaeum sp.]|nr:PKD domain-containing protein [Candidatus Syntrophoarchaeum sp.]
SEGGYYLVSISGYRLDNDEYGSAQKQIYVDRGPTAKAKANLSYITAPTAVEFNGSLSHADPYGNRSISRYEWEFNDGVNLSGKVVVREINQTTTAKLTVYDNSSDGVEHCKSTSQVTVELISHQVPAISYPGIVLLIGLLALAGVFNLQRPSRRRR